MAGCPDDPTEVTAELGTGTIEWSPVANEQDLELIAGPQGGHHFIVHARIRDIAPGDPDVPGDSHNPSTTFEVYSEDGRRIDGRFPPYQLGFVPMGNGWYALPSGRILQLVETEVEALYGARARIVVHIEDAEGHAGTDERWVRVVPGAEARVLP